jgi:hypothetical protein
MSDWKNPYYNPEKFGLEIIAELNPHLSYEFDIVVVWKDKEGNLFWAGDAGCSCPTPFERYTSIETLDKFNYNEIESYVKASMYGASDSEKRDFLAKVRQLA